MSSKILLFLLAMQSSYCMQNEPLDLANVYYVSNYNQRLNYDQLICVFPKKSSVNVNQVEYKLSDGSWYKIAIKKWFHTMVCSALYNVKTPYIYPNPQDLEWLSKNFYNHYVQMDDFLEPCPDQFSKITLFVEKPHCGDLAFCIRQTNNIEDQDQLLKLLDASYEIQKLIHFEDEYFMENCHLADFRSNAIRAVQMFYCKIFGQSLTTLYRSNIKKCFFNAVISYLVTIIKNSVLLFLMLDTISDYRLKYGLYGLIGISMMTDIIRLGSLVNLKLYECHLITLLFVMMIYTNILSKEMYYYPKIFSTYWIGSASFFLTILCYKYYNFEKVMDGYEIHCKKTMDSYDAYLLLKASRHPVLL